MVSGPAARTNCFERPNDTQSRQQHKEGRGTYAPHTLRAGAGHTAPCGVAPLFPSAWLLFWGFLDDRSKKVACHGVQVVGTPVMLLGYGEQAMEVRGCCVCREIGNFYAANVSVLVMSGEDRSGRVEELRQPPPKAFGSTYSASQVLQGCTNLNRTSSWTEHLAVNWGWLPNGCTFEACIPPTALHVRQDPSTQA